ncbi:helix-turn-helix domain-containing protein [Fodinicola feengrottensis]|uniref:helix-turn-helix domain-containing protein n=1 Tax=Fodinicola feengrottensis TaxID=435914 RepID=UPI0013D407DD|nr:hypothetical protein [Fodinicola feengrottensis]
MPSILACRTCDHVGMSITLDVSRSTAASLVRVGGRFMTGDQLATAARAQLIPTTGLYFRGRIGAVGEVPSPVATSLLGIFPHWLVERIWAETAAFPAAAAVSAYAGACTSWGAEALSGLERADQVVEVAEKVIDRAESTALPLFAGWRAAHRPAAGPGRAGYALMLLRELRGGLHFAALRAAGLDIPIAVIGDPRPAGCRGCGKRTGGRKKSSSCSAGPAPYRTSSDAGTRLRRPPASRSPAAWPSSPKPSSPSWQS